MSIVLLHLEESGLGVLREVFFNCVDLSVRILNSLVSIGGLQESLESVRGLGEEEHLGRGLDLPGGGRLGGGPPAEQPLPHDVPVGLESPPGGLGGGGVLLGSGRGLLEVDSHNLFNKG